MSHFKKVVSLRSLAALEEQVRVAKVRLQQTNESDPAWERRVGLVIELVRKRDAALSPGDWPLPPAA